MKNRFLKEYIWTYAKEKGNISYDYTDGLWIQEGSLAEVGIGHHNC